MASSKTKTKAKPSKHLSKIEVMVIDSSRNAAGLLKSIFEEFGFSNIHVANDAHAGIQLLKKRPIHMIFTDWELKVYKHKSPLASDLPQDLVPVNGVQFVKRLRQSPNSPNPFITVVMVVEKATKHIIDAARDAGVNEVLLKPLDAREFCKRVISVIEDKRIFVTAPAYRGPDRRRARVGLTEAGERRKREIRIIRNKKKTLSE